MSGQVAVVVGVGAEAGLGARLCARFGREGLHVLVAGRTVERVERVAESIRRAGGAATALPTDTTREPDVMRLFEAADAIAPLRGRPPFAAFAAAKAGLRAVAQSMAREFGPKGVHVAHVVIDGGIAGERLERFAEFVRAKGEDGLLDLDAIADTYWMLHHQHRTAWTHELDLRPFKEPF
jgi:NAD(P)-dependent dehydrogenase (short-subunit alcohol dehydrogenase family)